LNQHMPEAGYIFKSTQLRAGCFYKRAGLPRGEIARASKREISDIGHTKKIQVFGEGTVSENRMMVMLVTDSDLLRTHRVCIASDVPR
jgi:hypothetical protein